MIVPLKDLGFTVATCAFSDMDFKRKKRVLVLSRCLKGSSNNNSVILEALMYCMDYATQYPWRPFILGLKPIIPPETFNNMVSVLEWLEKCFELAKEDKLEPSCLEVDGGYIVCK